MIDGYFIVALTFFVTTNQLIRFSVDQIPSNFNTTSGIFHEITFGYGNSIKSYTQVVSYI